MGMFGFGCPLCWDKNCNCSATELEHYYKKREGEIPQVAQVEWTKTNPPVTAGHMIQKDGTDWLVKEVRGGVGYVEKITNNPEEIDYKALEEPYDKVCATVREDEVPDFKKIFGGVDSANGPDSQVHLFVRNNDGVVEVIDYDKKLRGYQFMYNLIHNKIGDMLQEEMKNNHDNEPRMRRVDPRLPEDLMRERGIPSKVEHLTPGEVLERYGDNLPQNTIDALRRLENENLSARLNRFKDEVEPTNEANERSYEMIAQICHAAHNAYCEGLGQTNIPWEMRSEKHKQTVISSVEKILEGKVLNPEHAHIIFVTQKIDAGWTYGEEYDVIEKTNPRLVVWEHLPIEEKLKDIMFFNIVNSFKI